MDKIKRPYHLRPAEERYNAMIKQIVRLEAAHVKRTRKIERIKMLSDKLKTKLFPPTE